MITCRNCALTYTQDKSLVTVYDNLSLEVEAGECLALIGPSGCGKSSLLYMLAGLRPPTQGSIQINGREVTSPRLETGFILQEYGLFPWLTVEKNILLGLKIRGMTLLGPSAQLNTPHSFSSDKASGLLNRLHPSRWRHQISRRFDRLQLNTLLEELHISSTPKRYPGQLSGGQRQRVALARSLILNPDLLLMDEPFSSLDALTRESMQRLLLSIHKRRHLTIVLVTHSIEEAVLLGTRILVLTSFPARIAGEIMNPLAGSPEYRTSEEFFRQTRRVRALLTEGES